MRKNQITSGIDRQDRLLATSNAAAAERIRSRLGTPPRTGEMDTGAEDGPEAAIYALTWRIQVAGAPVYVTVGRRGGAEDILIEEVERELLREAALVAFPLGLGALAIALLTIRASLRPIRALAREAAAIGPGAPGAPGAVRSSPLRSHAAGRGRERRPRSPRSGL